MFSKLQKLFILICFLILAPFMVGAETWADPTCDPPACNTDGPVWSNPTVSQDAYADLDYSNEDDTPIFTITDSRSTGATNGSLYVSSLVNNKPALKISSTGSTVSSYAAVFSASSAPALYLTGGLSFAGRGTDLTYTPEGLLYYNTASHLFKFYNGSSWVELDNQWTTNGDELYRSFAASAIGQGIGIKSGDATDPNDDYNLDIYRKALGTDDAAAYARLEDSATTDYASASMGAYATTSNYLTGVSAKSTADDGMGVYAIADATGAVTNYGGYFRSDGDNGVGVFGQAPGATATAVYGAASSNGASDSNAGAYFFAAGGNGVGVIGHGTAPGVSSNYGGMFAAYGDSGIGVRAAGPVTPTTTALALQLQNGAMAMEELAVLPTNIADYGNVYVKSSDSLLYFQDDSGTEYSLTDGGDGTSLWDTDGNTGVQIEESANDDIFRVDTAGVERLNINASGDLVFAEGSGKNAYFNIEDTGDPYGSDWSYPGVFLDVTNDRNVLYGGSVYVPGNVAIGSTTANYQLNVVESSSSGRAVYGTATGTGAQTNYGAYFESDGNTGIGVYGHADYSSTDSTINYGGYFVADAGKGYGVYGQATSTADYNATGGYFTSSATRGRGVQGIATDTSSTYTKYGIYGRADGATDAGVYGWATSGDASNYHYGLWGQADNTNGIGVFSYGTAYSGYFTDAPVVITDDGSTAGAIAVASNTYATGAGELYVEGDIESDNNIYADRYYGNGSTSYYVDPNDTVTSAYVAGDMSLGRASGADDDYLYFDQNVEYLRWESANSRFYMSDDLYVYYDLSTGSDVMAAAAVYIDSNFNGTYDYLYFGDSSATSNYLRFEDANDRFYLNDDLYVLGVVSQSSDRRLKKNIKGIDSALDIVNSLEPVSFDWKEDNKSSYGFIAQDMYEVLPELVHKPIDENFEGDYWGVDYSKMSSVLTAAMQEQQAQIENQGKEIDELKKQIEYLMENLK